jgi:hypothetical protein
MVTRLSPVNTVHVAFVVRGGFLYGTTDDGKRNQAKNDSLDDKCLIEGRPIATSVVEPKLFTYSGSGSGSDFGKVPVSDPNPDPDQDHI